MKRDIDRRIGESLRRAAAVSAERDLAAEDIAAIRADLIRRGFQSEVRSVPQSSTHVGGRPAWSIVMAAAIAVLAFVPVARESAGAPPSELSRVVQPVLQSLPSGTKFETNMIFVLDATASYYRDIWRE